MSKYKYSKYCEYAYSCDKDINCIDGDFCAAFEHTKEFSSLEFDDEDNQHTTVNIFDPLLGTEEE